MDALHDWMLAKMMEKTQKFIWIRKAQNSPQPTDSTRTYEPSTSKKSARTATAQSPALSVKKMNQYNI